MKMDAFAQLVRHREQAARKIKVHKTYINEDPNVVSFWFGIGYRF